MKIPISKSGKILNSSKSDHFVRVEDDGNNTGGFLIFERWQGSNGPNPNGEFDSWVESRAAVEQFFAEAKWEMAWPDA